jgi:hypothetical protein
MKLKRVPRERENKSQTEGKSKTNLIFKISSNANHPVLAASSPDTMQYLEYPELTSGVIFTDIYLRDRNVNISSSKD